MKSNKELFKKALIPVLIVILLAVVIIGFVVKREHDNKLHEDARKSIYDALVCTYRNQDELPTLEIGEDFTYSSTVDELSQIPDKLRSYIKSYPRGAKITVDTNGQDLTLIGEKTFKLKMEMPTVYGDLVTREQDLNVYLDDTQKPEIILTASKVSVTREKDVRDNIRGIVDPVYGRYVLSPNGETHTYSLDMSEIQWTVPGEYNVYIRINDNGKILDYYFTAVIDDPTAVTQPEQQDNNSSDEIIIINPTQDGETEVTSEELGE